MRSPKSSNAVNYAYISFWRAIISQYWQWVFMCIFTALLLQMTESVDKLLLLFSYLNSFRPSLVHSICPKWTCSIGCYMFELFNNFFWIDNAAVSTPLCLIYHLCIVYTREVSSNANEWFMYISLTWRRATVKVQEMVSKNKTGVSVYENSSTMHFQYDVCLAW